MRPNTLALLATAAIAALATPGIAHAQQTAGSMTPSLECGDDTPATPGTTPGGTGGTGSGGTGTGGTPTPSPTLGVDPDVLGGGGGVTGGGGTPTPTPTATPGGAGGGTVQYLTNPSIANMRVTQGKSASAAGGVVNYYRASGTDIRYRQNLTAVKTYPTPSGPGVLATVAGQKILLKDRDQVMTGLSSGITRIIDEINLSAAALGYPDPIVTAGHDTDGHSSTSLHYTGNALDMRCNSVNGLSGTQCKKWVVTLANALGPSYDVIFEDYGNNNSHIHVGYKG